MVPVVFGVGKLPMMFRKTTMVDGRQFLALNTRDQLIRRLLMGPAAGKWRTVSLLDDLRKLCIEATLKPHAGVATDDLNIDGAPKRRRRDPLVVRDEAAMTVTIQSPTVAGVSGIDIRCLPMKAWKGPGSSMLSVELVEPVIVYLRAVIAAQLVHLRAVIEAQRVADAAEAEARESGD